MASQVKPLPSQQATTPPSNRGCERAPSPPGNELLAAAIRGNIAVIEQWLAAGGDVEARDGDGSTLLMRGATLGLSSLVSLLLAARCSIDAQDTSGATALMRAAGRGHAQVCRALLEAGADTRLRAADGRTSCEIATAQGHHAIAEMLGGEGGEEPREKEQESGVQAHDIAEAISQADLTQMVRDLMLREATSSTAPEAGGEPAAGEQESRQDTVESAQPQCDRGESERTRGNQLFSAGEYGEAVEAYSQALRACLAAGAEARGHAARVLANRAACRLKQKRHEEAVADAQMAAEMDPSYAKAHYRRAVALQAMGRKREAMEAMARARQLEHSVAVAGEEVKSAAAGVEGAGKSQAAGEEGEGMSASEAGVLIEGKVIAAGGGGGATCVGAAKSAGVGSEGKTGNAADGREGKPNEEEADDERVVSLVEALQTSTAGSEARRTAVIEIYALLERVSSPESSKQDRLVLPPARAQSIEHQLLLNFISLPIDPSEIQ
ncbi:MAG: hypothetical protein SGPRY_005845 [Prymnesium sp.]